MSALWTTAETALVLAGRIERTAESRRIAQTGPAESRLRYY
jgi:hypothetical protein